MHLWVSDGEKDAVFRLVLSSFSVTAISLSLVQIFKYLRNIIALPIWLCWFIVTFFGVFSTNILLSFTPETYTYTLLFLCIFNHYTAIRLKNGSNISAFVLIPGTVSIGGMTITNAIKVFIPVLMERNLFQSLHNIFNAVWRILAAITIFILLFLYRINFDITGLFTKIGEQYEKFSQSKNYLVWDMIYSWFLGGNILFSNFLLLIIKVKKGFTMRLCLWIPTLFSCLILSSDYYIF